MPDIQTQRLIRTGSVAIRDVVCKGTRRTVSAEEAAPATHLVFTYRGVSLGGLAAAGVARISHGPMPDCSR